MSAENDCGWFNPHKWSKWEQYKEHFRNIYQWGKLAGRQFPSEEDWQKRQCIKCGKVEKKQI